jgi:hypothetical protein
MLTLVLATRDRTRRRSIRFRTALLGAVALLSWTLAGCGDPDEDDGGGGDGGGYVSQQSIEQEIG